MKVYCLMVGTELNYGGFADHRLHNVYLSKELAMTEMMNLYYKEAEIQEKCNRKVVREGMNMWFDTLSLEIYDNVQGYSRIKYEIKEKELIEE